MALDSIHLKICVYLQPPFAFMDATKQGNSAFSGWAIDHFLAALPFLGNNISDITYDFYQSPDGSSGSLINATTNTYGGCIGAVANGGFDSLGIGMLSVSSARRSVVSFSAPILKQGLELLVLRPSPSPDAWAFLKPFASEVWTLFFVMPVAVGVLSYIIDKVSPFGKKIMTKKELGSFSLRDYIANVFKASVGMKDSKPQKAWSTRVLVLAFFFFVLVMITLYVAKLIEIFSTPFYIPTVQTVADLNAACSQTPPLHWGLINKGSIYDFMMSTQDSSYLYLRRGMIVFSNATAALDALHAGSIAAIIYQSTTLDYLVNQPYDSACNSMTVGEQFQANFIAWTMPLLAVNNHTAATTAYKRQLLYSNAIQQVAALPDQMQRLTTKWYYDNGACYSSSGPPPAGIQSLGIDSLLGLWYMLLLFTAVAFIVVAAERAMWRCHARKRQAVNRARVRRPDPDAAERNRSVSANQNDENSATLVQQDDEAASSDKNSMVNAVLDSMQHFFGIHEHHLGYVGHDQHAR